MNFIDRKAAFEREKSTGDSAVLTFVGVDGFDVYNCSIPFSWNGKDYIYGRVERRREWARSWVRLFEKTAPDTFTLVPDSMIYQLEDPYISVIGDELVMGGTHVRMDRGEIDTFYGYFYRGSDLEDLRYFTTGPNLMKDIRLVQLEKGLGVFSRPRNEEIQRKYGSASIVGFSVIPDLESLSADVVENAPIVSGLFDQGEWGGCNQCYRLDSGLIGVIGHKCYAAPGTDGVQLNVYVNISFVMDPKNNTVIDEKIIATRSSYPDAPAKKPELADCAFTSGIVLRAGGKADLYSGLGDTAEGRVVIDNPFAGFGQIVTP